MPPNKNPQSAVIAVAPAPYRTFLVFVKEVINEAVLAIGEKINVRRFVRYEMGEGLEKRQDNLAEEIAKMTNKK